MKSEYSTAGLVLIFLTFSSSAQVIYNETLKCSFEISQGIYSCGLPNLSIVDDESQFFTFDVNNHLDGRTNDDVEKVEIYGGNVPFIITQIFTTFPNVKILAHSFSGLSRVQSKALVYAGNLEKFSSYGNSISTIQAFAFTGASSLIDIDLYNNQIEKVDETAFSGLEALQFLNIAGNNLTELHQNTFQSLENLAYLALAINQLESLDGRLFSNNRLLRDVNLYDNQIDAIGRGLLDGLEDLVFFNMRLNRCVDSQWTLSGETTIETVQKELEECFENFVEPPTDDVRKFTLELRGSLVIRDEDGNEILRL